MDFSLARTNMVKSQVVPNGVNDALLLGALMGTPREPFVAATHKEFAYSDYALPMSATRRCLKPLQIAQLIQALAVKNGQRVLVAGAGLGYEAALLAHLGVQVFALESDSALVDEGKQQTASSSVKWQAGDPRLGWPDEIPFDAILLCGSVSSIPDDLLNQMSENGTLVAIVGSIEDGNEGATIMQAVRIKGRNRQQAEALFETFAFPMLEGGLVSQPSKKSHPFVL